MGHAHLDFAPFFLNPFPSIHYYKLDFVICRRLSGAVTSSMLGSEKVFRFRWICHRKERHKFWFTRVDCQGIHMRTGDFLHASKGM